MSRRFFLDNDGSNFFYHMHKDTQAAVDEAVRECPENVTTYLLCSGAGTFYFPTRVGDVCPHAKPLVAALKRGLDPFGMFVDALKAAGKEVFATYRMNDVHDPDAADRWNLPRVRRLHPDCIVDPEAVREGRAEWMSYCMDYGRAEVREYVLATMKELVDLYDIDGIQMDWMRFPRHLAGTPDEVWEKRDVLTRFVAEVRAMLHTSGKHVLLSARVPTSPAGCRALGIDVGTWALEKLVDFVTASPFLTTDFTMPLDELREMMGELRVPLYAAFDFGHGTQHHCPESLRAAATGLYASGADGVYVFNFPCWIERLGARPYDWLEGLHEPRKSSRKPLLFSVSHSRHRVRNVDLPAQLPVTLEPGHVHEFSLDIPAAALPAWRALIQLAAGGDMSARLNGAEVPERPAMRRSELFVEYIPHGQAGELRPRPGDCRTFQPAAEALSDGLNRLEIRNLAEQALMIGRIDIGLW